MSKDIVVTPSDSANSIALTFYYYEDYFTNKVTITNATIRITEAVSGSGVIANVDIFRDGPVDWSDVYGKTIITGNIDASTISRFVLGKSQLKTDRSSNLSTAPAGENFILASNGTLVRP